MPTDSEYHVKFFVPGIPAPGGSKTIFFNKMTGKPIVAPACKRTKDWSSHVRFAALEAVEGRPPYNGPVRLGIDFVMPRPKSHFRTGKHAGELKPDAPQWHTKAPDTTKLIRSTEDALKGICWRDDSQVCWQIAVKFYCRPTGTFCLSGAHIDINSTIRA